MFLFLSGPSHRNLITNFLSMVSTQKIINCIGVLQLTAERGDKTKKTAKDELEEGG